MIKLVNITKIYNNDGVLTTGLHNVSLEFFTGEIVAIVGESGSGKSTLLNVLTKMDSFDEGEYYYKGNETSYFDIDDMDNFRKNKVGFIFQNYNIIDSYSVLENVMLPFILKGISRKEAKEKSLDLIKKVGLYERRKNRGSQLSGGEKQRCVIARALASDCDILACDEPTGNLDSQTSIEIIKLIKEVAPNKLVLIVTHDYELVKDIVTRKIKVHDGEISEDIIFNEVEKDQDEETNLDYSPIGIKSKLEVAKNNLLFTPRRTLLTSLVFFFVALFSLYMFQSTYYSISNQVYENSFFYSGDNKVVAYNINDKTGLDKAKIDKISNDYKINEFYIATGINCNVQIGGISTSSYVGYENNPMDLRIKGVEPVNKYECILLIPTDIHFSEKDFDYGTVNIYESGYNLINYEKDITITGYQIRSDVSRFTVTKCEYFENLVRMKNLTENLADIKIENSYGNGFYTYDPTSENTIIQLNKDIQNIENIDLPNLKFKDYDFGIDLDSFYKNSTSSTIYEYAVVVIFGNDIFEIIDSKIFEVSIYTNNTFFTSNAIKNIGYSCVVLSEINDAGDLQTFLNNLLAYFSVFISSTSLIVIFFISYLILSRIYGTKKKDYTILRTLGVSKKDMKSIVLFEVLIVTIITTIVAFLSIFILKNFVDDGAFMIFNEVSIFVCIFFFLTMLIFGYLIAKRFNKRLFKFTVTSTFKGGEF